MRFWKRFLILAVLCLVSFAASLFFFNKKNESSVNRATYIPSCVAGDYESVARYPDAQKGKNMYVSGTVIQVIESKDDVELRLQESSGNIWYIGYQYKNGEAHILEGDKLTVYGPCNGTITYSSIYGQQITVPCIIAYFIQ